jgi:hypothetical protein
LPQLNARATKQIKAKSNAITVRSLGTRVLSATRRKRTQKRRRKRKRETMHKAAN